MRVIGNILWFVLAGLWLAIGYVLAGLLAFVLIVTIPFGIASFRLASFVIWPFGRTTTWRRGAGVWSAIGNVVWVIFFGWVLALMHLFAGLLLMAAFLAFISIAPALLANLLLRVPGLHILQPLLYPLMATLAWLLLRYAVSAESLHDILGSRDRARAGTTAPPQGLFLMSVMYGGRVE